MRGRDSRAIGTPQVRLSDVDEAYGIEIRRGIAQLVEHLPENPDVILTLDRATLDRIRLGQLTPGDAIRDGVARLMIGTAADVARFFGYFDVPFTAPIALVVR